MAWYEVDSLVITVGSIAWGTLARTTTDDGLVLGLDEVAADPGFDYTFLFESIPGTVTHFRFTMNGFYDGSSGNTVIVYAWNYTSSTWFQIGTIVTNSADQDYAWSTLDVTNYSSGGQAKVRFYCDGVGEVGKYLRIDQLVIDNMTPTTAPPTTVPTTLVPTTTLTTPPPTTNFPYDPYRNVTFNCFGNNYAGVLIVETSITGHSLDASYELEDFELSIPITITGDVPASALYVLDDLELSIDISIEGWGVANDNLKNWVAWSKIGDVSFALDRVNDAGRRPMSWPGYVYQVIQLDKNVVIYGSGGITLAFPVAEPAPTFGFKDLSKVGVKNKTAVCGDLFVHHYIDILGNLCKVTTNGIENLGFDEFLSLLTNPVLIWDAAEQSLYISDEETGYVLNESVLTGGYANFTGLYRIKDNLTAVSPDTVVTKPVYIVTDIIDFKRRGLKTIENVNTDIISDLPIYGAIDYRYKKTEEFRTTDWVQLNESGVLNLRATATEFRIRIKSVDNGTFDISYMRIHFKFVDQRFTHDPKEEIDVY